MYLSRLYLILMLIALLLSFQLFQRFFFVNDPDRFDVKKIKDNDVDSGDIFLISFENTTKLFSNGFFGIEFMHPAIVVEKNNRKYVIELMNYSDKKGLQILELGEWINRNKNNIMLLNKLIATDKDRKIANDKLISFAYPFQDGKDKIKSVGGLGRREWYRYVYPSEKGYVEPEIKSNKTLCNEFTVYLLIKAGIIKPDKSVYHYHPDQFINMKGFVLEKEYMYKEHFLCDISNFFSTT